MAWQAVLIQSAFSPTHLPFKAWLDNRNAAQLERYHRVSGFVLCAMLAVQLASLPSNIPKRQSWPDRHGAYREWGQSPAHQARFSHCQCVSLSRIIMRCLLVMLALFVMWVRTKEVSKRSLLFPEDGVAAVRIRRSWTCVCGAIWVYFHIAYRFYSLLPFPWKWTSERCSCLSTMRPTMAILFCRPISRIHWSGCDPRNTPGPCKGQWFAGNLSTKWSSLSSEGKYSDYISFVTMLTVILFGF